MMAYPVRDSFSAYPQQYPMYTTRAHQSQTEAPTSLGGNPYASFAPAPQQQPQQSQLQQPPSRSPRSSGTPDSEDGSRPSLPSISNLLGIADRPGQENGMSLTQPHAMRVILTPDQDLNKLNNSNRHKRKLKRKHNLSSNTTNNYMRRQWSSDND